MDGERLGELMDRYAGALTLYARQWCASAEDVVQETFVKLAGMSTTPPNAAAWLFHVVRQSALTAARAERRRRKHERLAAPTVGWFQPDASLGLDAEAVASALARLPLDEREAVIAHLWGGLPFAEIGSLLKISTATAYRRYTCGVAALRQEFQVQCSTTTPQKKTRSSSDSPP